MNKIVDFQSFKKQKLDRSIQNEFENEYFELTDIIFEEWLVNDHSGTLNDFFVHQVGCNYDSYLNNLQAITHIERLIGIEGLSIHQPGATKHNPIRVYRRILLLWHGAFHI